MPRLVEGSEISGTLRRDIAASWGIEGTPVVAGGAGDNAAAACGLGVTAPGDAFLSLGTSGVVFAVTDSFSPAPEKWRSRLLPCHPRDMASNGCHSGGNGLSELAG